MIISDADAAAIGTISGAIHELIDNLSADESVVTSAMCFAVGRRIAEQSIGDEAAREWILLVSAHIAEATALFMKMKLIPDGRPQRN